MCECVFKDDSYVAGFRARKSVSLSCPFLLSKLSPAGLENSLGVGCRNTGLISKHGSTRARSGSTGMSCEDMAPIAARGGCGGVSDVAIVCMLAGVLIVSVRS